MQFEAYLALNILTSVIMSFSIYPTDTWKEHEIEYLCFIASLTIFYSIILIIN